MPGVGPTRYVQAAGFLKIAGGDNPLDRTWIHPESYAVAQQLLDELGHSPADLTDKTVNGGTAGEAEHGFAGRD